MVDVVVVGGGIAGASVAYELAADRSVVLLETEAQPGRHATARSAATYVPGHGVAEVRALISASGPRFAELAAELGAPPLLAPRPVLWVAVDADGERELATLLADRAGEPDAPQRLDPAEAVRRCPALDPAALRAAALTTGAADIDTDALHAGYLRGLRARGGSVRTGAPVTALARDGDGWRIEAGGDVLHAGLVVDAAGAWADEVAALAGVPRLGLAALRRTIAVARVPDPSQLRAPSLPWAPSGRPPMVIDAAERFYFKAEGDDLLVSPSEETPDVPRDARPDPLDVATALERVAAVTRLGLRSVRTSWAGLRTFAPDRRPVVGAWPGHPGFVFVAGQGGSGFESVPALSTLAASVVRGEAPPPALAPARLAGM